MVLARSCEAHEPPAAPVEYFVVSVCSTTSFAILTFIGGPCCIPVYPTCRPARGPQAQPTGFAFRHEIAMLQSHLAPMETILCCRLADKICGVKRPAAGRLPPRSRFGLW